MIRFFCRILLILLPAANVHAAGRQAIDRSLAEYDSLLNIDTEKAHQALNRLNLMLDRNQADPYRQVQIWYRNSRWFQDLGMCDSALFCAMQARRISLRDAGRVWAFMAMGGAHRCNRNTDSALFYFILAEKQAGLLHDTAALIRTHFYLGHVHSELGKFNRASAHYRISSQLSEATGDKEFICRNALASASNLADRGLTAKALPALKYALYQCEKNNLIRPVATACNNLGMLYESLGQYELAARYFRRSLEIQASLNNRIELFNEYNNIAMTAMLRERYSEAIPLLLQAEALAGQMGGHPMLPEVFHNLALCYAQTGQFEKAYEYKDAQKTLSDSLRSTELLKHAEQLQEAYQAEKRQLEIINLKQENEVKDLKNNLHLKQRDAITGLAIGLLFAAVLVYFILRQKVRNAQAINQKNEQIHRQQMDEVLQRSELQSIHTMLETQEKERQRIAEDLHDRVGSMLSAVKLQFSRFRPEEQHEDQQQYKKVAHLLDEACEEIRMVSHNLVSGTLSTFGLVPALNDLVKALEESGHLAIRMSTHGLDKRMPGPVEINIYRIFQELLNNTLRHAQATQVEIDLTLFNGQLTCIYSDNGKGFDSASPQHSGIGLKNMYSRADKLGGSLHIDSGKGNGSTFVFTIHVP